MADPLFDLTGKSAVVTGGSRGIGEAIAHRLAEHGARVVVASRKIDACEEVASAVNAATGRNDCVAAACNVSRKEDLEALVHFARKTHGQIDILVSNAAVNTFYGPSERISDEQFEKIMKANVFASHWLSQMVMPEMAARREGVFLMISSIAGFVGSPTLGAYSISKAADLQLVRNLAVEYGPHNVRANCICPGVVKTYFAEALWKDPKVAEVMTKQLPLRRFGEPDDIAGAAVFLASPAARWMTGQAMVVDGGALISLAGL